MMLDIKTLMMLYLIINVISAGAVAIIWWQNRGRFAGIALWLADMILQVAGSILIVMRGRVPDLISMTLSNTMVLAGALILFIGLERFTGKKGWQIHNYFLLFVFAVVSAYFVVVQPDLAAREIVLSAVTMIITFQCCWLLLRRVDKGMRQMTGLTGIVFACYAAFSLARGVLHLTIPLTSGDFFRSGAVDALSLTAYIILSFCLTVSLVLMVNRRLLADVESRETALRESEAKYRSLFDNAEIALFRTRISDGKLIEINARYAQMAGYSNIENCMAEFNAANAYADPNTRKEVLRVLQEKGTVTGYETEIIRRDGTRICILFSATIFPQQGFLEGSIVDITKRKQTEEEIKRLNERFALATRAAHLGIWDWDLVNNNLVWDQQMYELYGFKPEDHTTAYEVWLKSIHPDDQQYSEKESKQALLGEKEYDTEFRVVWPDGSTRHIKANGKVFRDADGKPLRMIGINYDITEHKLLEEERQRVDKLESIGVLAGGIAHDFNNILTAILGNISLAGIEAAPGSELQNSLEQAEKAAQRAKYLTAQLLTFSKGGAPVMKLSSLTELLKDTARFALRGSNVKCHFSMPADLWHAEIDTGQVSQIIHNLVINAQQAMPTGGRIEISAENITLNETRSLGRGLPVIAGDYVRVVVADHGTGIPRENLEKIFDPFFTTKQQGNGLGLATSFSIARQHGGYVSVESEVGTGSTFYLYLPASTQTAAPKKAKPVASKPSVKVKILVMDDEKGIRDIAGRMLKHLGYEDIEFAADGVEAIELYKTAMKSGNPFTVAILDLTIAGGMGGEIAIQKLLKIDPGVKAIVSSGYIDDSVIAQFRDYGFSGMVAKPYTLAELGKAVQDLIG